MITITIKTIIIIIETCRRELPLDDTFPLLVIDWTISFPPPHSSILYNKFRRIERERESLEKVYYYFYYLGLLFLLLFHSELHARNCVLLLYWDGKVRESWEFLEIGEIRDLYFYAKSNFSRTRRLDSFLEFVYDRRCFEFRGLLWASFQTARGLKIFSSFILCLVFC